MKVAFARLGQVPQPNVRTVTLVVPVIVFISSILSYSAAASSDLPEHAYATTTYGDFWKCERGFKKTEDECLSIKLPEHAFLSSYGGNSWKCEGGFKREGDLCSAK